MEEVFKRENDKMVKLIQHNEKSLSNQDVYNHWVKLCSEEAQLNQQLREVQAKIDMIRERKEKIREISMDCEKRIPKPKHIPKEVNLNE